LKLTARAADLPALRRTLEDLAGGKSSRARLVSTYYETADLALNGKGLVLRVRERDGHFVQTVKSEGRRNDSALARGEWEDEVADARPHPEAPESGAFLVPEVAERLAPMFRTEVTRDTVELSPAPDIRIEAAIDRGQICSGGELPPLPISEIELELKNGPVTALYDTAMRLLEAAPLRVERRSKAERGYRLASGKTGPPGPAKAEPVALDPSLCAEGAFHRIGHACLDHAMRNEAAVLAGKSDGVHQMRIAVRRLRAALSAFSDLLPEAQHRRISDELRWLADLLGDARDLDVFKNAIVQPAAEALPDPKRLQALASAVETRRRTAYGVLRRAVRSPRYTALVLDLLRWFDSRGWRDPGNAEAWQQPSGEIAPAVLDKRRRGVKKRRRRFARQSPGQRHRLRIALKKLRYTGELFRSLYAPEATAKFLDRLKTLQDQLGDANDVQVGRAIVADLAQAGNTATLEAAGRAVLDWHEDRLAGADKKTRKELRRLLDAEPFWRG